MPTKKSNALTTQEESITTPSPVEMISKAVAGGVTPEQLEKLLQIQLQWEANEAKKAYHVAMTAFKADPIKIDKDKKVGFSTPKGNVGYSHASLANVVSKITAGLSKYGLSASWRTQQNGQIVVTCRITHVMGHSEETTLQAPSDTSGSKNAIQAIGSTITYLERYSLLSLLGLATYDQDDDGKVSEGFISETELNQLYDLILDAKIDEKKFVAWLKVSTLDQLPKSRYKEALEALKAKHAKIKAKEKVNANA